MVYSDDFFERESVLWAEQPSVIRPRRFVTELFPDLTMSNEATVL